MTRAALFTALVAVTFWWLSDAADRASHDLRMVQEIKAAQ